MFASFRPWRGALTLAALAATVATGAQAKTFRFDTDPFAGTTALQTPGRQVVANELFIPTFDLANDRIEFDPGVFGVGAIHAFTGFAADIPDEDFNFVVLRTLDADNDPTNGNQMAAPLAANLIAAQLSHSGAGFFLYLNSALNLTRLVYSTDLSRPDADLKIIARFQDQTGPAGVAALAQGGPQLAPVPEPAAWSMMILGFGLLGGVMRRTRRTAMAV